MLNTPKVEELYKQIQESLFYMIPEKWDKVYLYASIVDQKNNLQTGEMFFYYIPKGILKKNPVNVYEVPMKFNIDESRYFGLADELYGIIKSLRLEYYYAGEKLWSNVTISIESFKFTIEYNYDDLLSSNYSSYDRHVVWRFKHLNMPLSSLSKKEKEVVKTYLQDWKITRKEKEVYSEPIYRIPTHNLINYNKEEKEPGTKKKLHLRRKLQKLKKKQLIRTITMIMTITKKERKIKS